MKPIVFFLALVAAIPVQAQEEEKEERRGTKGLWPFIYSRDDGDKSEFGVLWPLIRFESEPGKKYTALLPFFSIERDEKLRLIEVYALWPFIRWYQKGEETRFRIPPLVWHKQDPSGGYTSVFPLYWNFWSRDRKEGVTQKSWTEFLFPFYWNIGQDPGNRYFHIWPLYGHNQRENYDSYWFLWPFFRYFADREKGEVGLDFPLPIAAYRQSKGAYEFRIIPLIHWKRTPTESQTVITPFFGHLRGEDTSTTWLFPLFLNHRNKDFRLASYLANLVVLHRDSKYRSMGFLWPLIGFREEGQKRSMHIFPLVWGSSSPERHWFLVLPLLWSRGSRASSELLLFPLLYNRRVGEGDAARGMTMVFPLYYDFREPDSRLTMLLPLFGSYSEGEDHTRYVFPTYLDMKRGDRSYLHAWPFFGHHQVGDDYDRYFFLAPFFSYTSDRRNESWGIDFLWPLFSYKRGKDSASLRLVPLAWYDRSLDSSSLVIFPFWWQSKGPDSSHFFLFPFYGEERRGETFKRQFFLGGTYVRTVDKEKDLERHDILYPLFTHEREGERTLTAVRPLFWREKSPDSSRTILLPLFWHQRDRDRSLFLSLAYSRGVVEGQSRWDNVLGFLYHRSQVGARTSQDILFPLIHTTSGPDESRIQVRPFFWHSREGSRGSTTLLPFYHHSWGPGREAFNIFPFYTRIDRSDGTKITSVLGPLYYRTETRLSISEYFLWPFGHHFKTRGVEKWQVRPFFWHEKLAGLTERTILFPFYWHYRSDLWNYFHIWPLFGTEDWSEGGSRYRKVSTLWPFFSYTWDQEDQYRRLDLLYPFFSAEWRGDSATGWLFPLVFYDRVTRHGVDDTDLYVAPPLFYYGSNVDGVHWSVLWKLITYDQRENETDFRVLLEWIRVRKTPDRSLVRFFPLFSVDSRGPKDGGKFDLWLLWPLFHYSSEADAYEFSILWKLFSYSEDARGVRINVLHNFFRYESTEDHFLFELNPLFSIETTPQSTTFSLLGGLFSIHAREDRTDVGLLYFIEF
ncbi:MAG: hypothetical protein O7H41_07820 [Planctomycetota bacterium]|nr:hypothetical protein [Planctomycetota bacterium]